MNPTEPLWTAREIAIACEGRTSGHWFADGIAIDSREVLPGDLFIALPGGARDGHDFIAEALAAGATGVLASHPPEGVGESDPRLVAVRDTSDALRALAAAARYRMRGEVLAVTGSAGKTSVKEMLRLALGREALAHASARSFNNHVGAPLSLARMPRSSRYAIFELGMNAPGEIGPLARMVAPDIAVVTNVGAAHAEAFEDERAIARAKAEIFEGLAPGATAAIGIDHDHGDVLLAEARARGLRTLSVSLTREDADIRPLRLVATAELSCMTADLAGLLATVKIGAPGRHQAMNGLLTLAAVMAAGGDVGLAGLALAEFRAPAGRGLRRRIAVRDGSFLLIDDSYNASPLSLAAAFDALAELPFEAGGRRFAVLADMAELGGEARRLHLALASRLAAAGIEEVAAIGPHMAALAEAAGIACLPCEDAATATAALARRLRAGDAVLVKGANRAGLAEVVRGLARLESSPARRGATPLAAE